MTSVEDCKHGMNPEWCADCNGKAKAQEREVLELRASLLGSGKWIEAHYSGTCILCGTWFP